MISPTQQKKLEKLAKVLDGGDVALLTELNALEDRLDGLEGQIPDVKKALDRVESLVDGEKGDDGDDYILTENDKREIASFITVPIVEKVIEKREVIKEKPVVTKETTKEIIKEIREVKVDVPYIDNASIAYLEDEIKRVEDKIPEVIKQRETNFGFVIRDVVAGTGVTIDKTDLNRPIINAEAVAPTIKDTFGITVDGATVVLTTGTKGYRYIEQNCTITGWDLRSDVSGSIVFDVKRGGVSLAGTEKPTLTAAASDSNLALTTWTTSLVAGDIIEFVIDSASTITRATLTILITKT